MREIMILFKVCIYTETSRFLTKKVIVATDANICSF